MESSLVGEVTPPGLRGEGEDRVRANNLGILVTLLNLVIIMTKTGMVQSYQQSKAESV